MTGQHSDTFLHKGEVFSLIGYEGCGLVHPRRYGMVPEMIHTACYRGYYATYEITESALLLRKLTLREKDGNYCAIGGVDPEIEDHQAIYSGLNEVVNYSGKLRLAKGLIGELYVHMGFQKATAYKTVLDITFRRGKVIEIKDRSEEMKKNRGEFKKHYDSGDIAQTTFEAFDLGMDIE
ncbi:MAG: hypothetical protein JXA03_06035 [Bacteroidales bacterium]|nr:hypothetical protein [Bacteroidales bacterium]